MGWITFAEYASIHRDGTVTLVRSGIDRWWADLPTILQCFVFVELAPGDIGAGTHKVSYDVYDPSGLQLMHLDGELKVESAEKATRVSLPLDVNAQKYGEYTVRVKFGESTFERTLHLNEVSEAPEHATS